MRARKHLREDYRRDDEHEHYDYGDEYRALGYFYRARREFRFFGVDVRGGVCPDVTLFFGECGVHKVMIKYRARKINMPSGIF